VSEPPIVAVAVLAALTLLPLAAVTLTSFLKIAVVLSILRSALGAGNIPPAVVVSGLAVILTLFVMAPVGRSVADAVRPHVPMLARRDASAEATAGAIVAVVQAGAGPIREFLSRHAGKRDRALFTELANRLGGADRRTRQVEEDDFLVLAPAFITSELAEAFTIGFLVFLPFVVIDLVVGNALLALGIHMLAPTAVSLPLKLLLFVMVDGWQLLSRGLVVGYL
jgi:type III secretion protein R